MSASHRTLLGSLLLAASLASCTSVAQKPAPAEKVVLAGGPAQEAAIAGLRAGFPAKDAYHVTYESVGSHFAFNGFLAGEYTMAVLGHAPSATEWQLSQEACGGRTFAAPILPSALAVSYNLDGDPDLRLSPSSVDGLLNGRISRWNDPALQADNPDLVLPDDAVTVVRSKGDAEQLAAVAAYIRSGGITVSELTGPGMGEVAEDSVTLAETVANTSGAVAVMELRHAGGLQLARLAAGGSFVAPNEATGEDAFSSATVHEVSPGRWEISLLNAYPLVLVSYAVTCLPPDGDLSGSFMAYAVSKDGQNAASSAAGSPPLPPAALARIESG